RLNRYFFLAFAWHKSGSLAVSLCLTHKRLDRLPANMSYALPIFSPISTDEEIVEQRFVLLENGTTPVEGYHYDLFSDDDLHTKKGQYSSGETVSVSGQSSLKLVTWIAGDSARKSA
ncbi:hypothetical protein, partial [Burkholderia diffusa]